jgi:hypothetical protein
VSNSAAPPRPQRSPLPPEEPARIGVLERNRLLGQRIARVLRASSRLARVAVDDEPAALRNELAASPTLLLCDAADVDLALEWARDRYPSMSVAAWTTGEMEPLLEAARRDDKLVALLGVPPFGSMPRPWELSWLVRRITSASAAPPHVQDLVLSGATLVKYRPQTSRERDLVTGEVQSLAERAGASSRIAQRAGEIAHELLMNAMYDAPVDHYGNLLYAMDRKQELTLAPDEVPTFRFATDGMLLGLQVIDRFGRLQRSHVLDGIARGRAAAEGGGSFLDTSAGGAGLGLSRIYTSATSMLVDVAPHRHTSVTVLLDLDIQPREARIVPSSLHLFVPPAQI